MHYRVLGPVEVVDPAGRALDTGGPKQRAVLAILLMEAGRTVPLDRLVDLLWGEEPPARATASLQAYISNLRRLLEPDRAPRTPASVLVTQPPGYALRVDRGDIDAALFTDLAAEGSHLLADGHPAAARDRLTQALALWRGDAYADFADESFARPEIVRLEALRDTAVEDRIDADLAMGEHARAAAELERLVSDQPLRERLWRQLALALYRSDRQAEALAVLRRAREHLSEELGLDPGPALQKLEADVLAQSPEIEWRPPAREEAPLPTTAAPPPPAPSAVPLPPAPEHSAPASDDAHLVALPLQPANPSVAEVPLVGRDDLLADLGATVDRARGGTGSLVLLGGDPGIGKTSLCEVVTARAAAHGVATAWGRCYETEGAPALWPWLQVLGEVLDRYPADVVADAARSRADLARLLPELVERVPADVLGALPDASDSDAARFRVYEAVSGFLSALAAHTPLVVVLEDLHWADVSSLRLLQLLASSVGSSNLLVLGTFRDAEGDQSPALRDALAALARHGVTRLSLPGLDQSDVARYAELRTGIAVAPAVAKALHARTDGNPFFVGELVRLLESEHGLDAAAMAERIDIPDGVRDVVRRRIARLPDEAQSLLAIASVLGREFDVAVLDQVAGVGGDHLLDLVDLAYVSGLVEEDPRELGRYRFAHALVRETLYDGLSRLRRARLHGRVGDALATGPDSDTRAAELAHHYGEAVAAGYARKAFEAAVAAAQQAETRLAHDETVVLYGKALAALDLDRSAGDEERYDLLVALGRSRQRVADFVASRETLLQAAAVASRLGDIERVARAAVSMGGDTAWEWGDYNTLDNEVVGILERCLEELPPGNSPLRCAALMHLAVQLDRSTDTLESRHALSAEAIAMAERLGDVTLVLRGRNYRHMCTWGNATAAEDLVELTETIAIARAAGQSAPLAVGYLYRSATHFALGNLAEMSEDLEACSALIEALRWRGLAVGLTWFRDSVEVFFGHLEGGDERVVAAYLKQAETTLQSPEQLFGAHMFQLKMAQGRLDELVDALRNLVETTTTALRHTALDLYGLALVECGRLDEAREAMGPYAEQTEPIRDWLYCAALSCRADLWSGLGDVEAAADLYARLTPYAGTIANAGTGAIQFGPVHYHLGRTAAALGDVPAAIGHYEDAVRQSEELGALPWLARSQQRLAELLRAEGHEPDRVAELLAAARETAEQIGMRLPEAALA